MHDFILGAAVIIDTLVGLVTSTEFVRVFVGTAIIVGVPLVGAAVIVGALAIARGGLRAVVRLAIKRSRP